MIYCIKCLAQLIKQSNTKSDGSLGVAIGMTTLSFKLSGTLLITRDVFIKEEKSRPGQDRI